MEQMYLLFNEVECIKAEQTQSTIYNGFTEPVFNTDRSIVMYKYQPGRGTAPSQGISGRI